MSCSKIAYKRNSLLLEDVTVTIRELASLLKQVSPNSENNFQCDIDSALT